jgi:uncharacterized protein (TIGR02594 family)
MSNPDWLHLARRHLGLRETPGVATTPLIRRWLIELRAWWQDDETPWCGTFCAAVMREAGLPLPKAWYRARAWLDWGQPLPRDLLGCIVVFDRAGGGHVGFVVGRNILGQLLVLGGNQGNQVSIAAFHTGRVLGYRWPPGVPYVAAAPVPLLASNGEALSTNEA